MSSLGLAGFIPMFPIYNWLLQKHGLRAPMLVGTAAMALGGLFRCGTYINIDFWWLLFVGQAVTSLSVAIQGTLGASLVAQWFPTEERVLATALITLTAPLGQAASSVIGPQVVRDHLKTVVTPDNCTDELLKQYRSNFECIQLGHDLPSAEVHNRHDLYMDINIFLFSQMVLAVLIFILTLVYFPPRPRLPPTMSAAGDRLNARIGIRKMIRNRDFWCFCIVASLPYGCLTGWIPLLEPNLRPLGYSQKEAGLISFFSLTVGAVMGICSGYVLSRLRRHTKRILLLLLILAAGMVTWFTLQCWGTAPHSTATLYISSISIVVCLYVLTTAAVDVLCEVSYPVPENFLMTASQLIIVMIAILFLIATFIPGFVIGITNWVLLGAVGVAIPLACFGRARLLRLELDSQQIATSDKIATA
ncbi:solute carrier family 49 member 4-like isoform X2 [Lineus longissimus]